MITQLSTETKTATTELDSADAQFVQTNKFLTIKDVAGCLKLSRRTIWRWCKAGRLPAVKVGHQWRITQRDFDNFVHRHGKIL